MTGKGRIEGNGRKVEESTGKWRNRQESGGMKERGGLKE